jgi:anti-sigma-K factor RskA
MNDNLHDLAAAYALDALEADERTAFEAHLADCAACRTEVDAFSDTAAELANLTEVTPPPSLKASLMAEIRDAPPSQATPTRPIAANPISEGPAAISPATPPAVGHPWIRAWFGLVAVLALITLGAGVFVVKPWVSPRTQITAADVLTAGDAVRATERVGDATVTLVRSNQLGRAVLVTTAMPAAPPDRVYQAWLKHADGSLSGAGVMPVASDQTLLLEGDARNTVGAGVTVEPPGGSLQPTSDPIVLVGLPA